MPLSLDAEGTETAAVLRLLNGPLCGCEYKLAGGTTLIVAGAAGTLVDDRAMPAFPENAIVVPLQGGVNFELVIEDNEDNEDNARNGFRVRTLAPDITEQVHVWQEVCGVGALSFALRPDGAAWAPGIADAQTAQDPMRTPPDRSKLLVPSLRMALIGVLALSAMLALGLTAWMFLSENKRVAEVAAVVAGSSEQYRIVKGRDSLIHIFAETERDAAWAKQALVREGLAAAARVSTLRDEEVRLAKLLQEHYPTLAYHRLRLAEPEQPLLILSRERAGTIQQIRPALTASMLGWMPYAQSVGIASWADLVLDQQAQAGLDRLGVVYARSVNADSVTYTIQGSLNDIELSRLQDFSESFYRDFGARYIYFSVELKDDLFQGKSYLYGSRGYVKMSPRHWFFPRDF